MPLTAHLLKISAPLSAPLRFHPPPSLLASKPVSAQEIAAEVKQELSVLLSTTYQQLNHSIEIAADRISQHVKTTTVAFKGYLLSKKGHWNKG